MKKKRIYFSVETKVRELNARILFAIEASLRGYSVVLGSRGSITKYRKYMQTGLVIFNGITIGLINELKKFKSLNFKTGCFDEEGLISYSLEHHTWRYDYNMFKNVDFLFAWGEREKEAIMYNKFIIDKENKVPITGNPRLDLIKPKFSVMFDKDLLNIKEKYGNFILITTMFPKTNTPQRSNDSNYLNSVTRSGYIRRDIDKYLAIEGCNNENVTRQELMKFISIFSTKYPKKKLLIKPHPSEILQTWQDFVKELKNKNIIVVNINEYSTNSFIKASDFLIACNCTTLVEGFFLDKGVINFIPYNKEETNFELPKIVSHNIKTASDLLNFIEQNDFSIKKKELNENEKKVLIYTIKNLDNIYSSKLMIDFLDRNIQLDFLTFDRAYPAYMNFLYDFKSKLKMIFKLDRKGSNRFLSALGAYQRQKNPGFSTDELIKIKNTICTILNIKVETINIREIYKDLFEFSISN